MGFFFVLVLQFDITFIEGGTRPGLRTFICSGLFGKKFKLTEVPVKNESQNYARLLGM